MTELLEVKNTMSSLEIAELTGKRHDVILHDTRNLLSTRCQRPQFCGG